MRILVTGGHGLLGTAICKELERREQIYDAPTHWDMDITDFQSTQKRFLLFSPDAVVHCAAWTAVDSAEEQPHTAMLVNGIGTHNIAEMCRRTGTKMLYVSTDYVFPGEGNHFYKPNDQTRPLNVYGASKLEGERAVQKLLKDYLIVRTSWVFGPNGRNFITTMMQLGKTQRQVQAVSDQIGSPTYTEDAAPLLYDLLVSRYSGIYHVTNEDVCSWAELAKDIFHQTGQEVKVIPVSSEQYPAKALRPHNSRLDKQALTDCGFIRLPDWRDAVRRYINMAKAGTF